jgi:hypothetical protein
MKCRRRHRHLDLRSPGTKLLETQDQPTQGMKPEPDGDATNIIRRLGRCL